MLLRYRRDLLECPAGRAVIGADLSERGQLPGGVVPRGYRVKAQAVRQGVLLLFRDPLAVPPSGLDTLVVWCVSHGVVKPGNLVEVLLGSHAEPRQQRVAGRLGACLGP